MKVLDLFSGIGGFSLGLERAGMETVAFCEIDPYARKVLKKHWPDVPIFNDITKLTKNDMPCGVDVICGGFPCQDISVAGKQAGIKEGTRSGLWFEMARLISEIRPRYAIMENVSALLSNGMGAVLGSLSEIGYDAEWQIIRASDVGLPHNRARVWIVAYPQGERRRGVFNEAGKYIKGFKRGAPSVLSELSSARWQDLERNSKPLRTNNGFPDWAHRLRGCGNAVVPQIPELIGKAIRKI